MIKKDTRILICGLHKIVNRAFIRHFKKAGFINVKNTAGASFDMLSKESTEKYFKNYNPYIVIYTGSVSGGIFANIKYPAEFIYKNIIAQTNVINSAKEFKVDRLIFFASSCVYPKNAPQPIKEGSLLTGPLEETSEAYAIAKLTGIKMCQAYNQQYGTNFFSVIPATIYGPEDDFDLKSAHVLPALIKRFHQAKEEGKKAVVISGSGHSRREFIFVDDLVDATIFLLNSYKEGKHINIGSSKDYSINELASIISEVVGFEGKIKNDTDKPDGIQQKLLDSEKITKLGWNPKISLREGIEITYNWFRKNL